MLTIVKAEYFTRDCSFDVTQALQAKVGVMGLDIVASNDIAGDPQVGVLKHLSVEYTLNGITDKIIVNEGERVLIPLQADVVTSKPKPIGKEARKVDIIIPAYENEELTVACLKSIKQHTKKGTYRVILVDNGSKNRDKALKAIRELNSIAILLTENKGFVGAINEGLRVSSAPLVCLLNNDTVVTKNWLEKLTDTLLGDTALGIVGPLTGPGDGKNVDSHHSLTLYSNLVSDMHNKSIDELNEELGKNYKGQTRKPPFVAFLCALIKREVIDRVGYLDTRFEMGMYDDNDYNLMAEKAGYSVALCLDTCIYHKGRSTFTLIEKTEGFDVGNLLRVNHEKLREKHPDRAL